MKSKLSSEIILEIVDDEMQRRGILQGERRKILKSTKDRVDALEKWKGLASPIRFIDEHQDSLFVFVSIALLLLAFKMIL